MVNLRKVICWIAANRIDLVVWLLLIIMGVFLLTLGHYILVVRPQQLLGEVERAKSEVELNTQLLRNQAMIIEKLETDHFLSTTRLQEIHEEMVIGLKRGDKKIECTVCHKSLDKSAGKRRTR